MSNNITKQVQENLNYPPLKKVDPNEQDKSVWEELFKEPSFSQAAIPSIMIAFNGFVQSGDGANEFLNDHSSVNWIEKVFGDHHQEAVQSIADYVSQSYEDTHAKMEDIARQIVTVVKDKLTDNASEEDLKTFFKNEKKDILTYLPPQLHMGNILENDSLDDKTNKMEGIVSSIVHRIGTAFDSTEAPEKQV